MGVTQHHDGVSGTSKQHVAFDYAKQLAQGRLDADAGNAQYLASLTGFSSGTFSTCDLANATICPSLETPSVGTPVLVLIWNHQGSVQTVNVRIPVGVIAGVNSYTVTGPDGSSIPSQLIQSTAADVSLRIDYYGASNVPVQWLIFQCVILETLRFRFHNAFPCKRLLSSRLPQFLLPFTSSISTNLVSLTSLSLPLSYS